MRRTLTATAFLLLTLTASAQTFSFGAPFPLTNTRYGTSQAYPVLRSSGDSLYAFWMSEMAVRMTRLIDGEQRGGLPVLAMTSQNGGIDGFDAAWNGTHFVVAASLKSGYTPSSIVTRLVSASGEPLAEPVTITAGYASAPALAFNGKTLLLLYAVFRDDGRSEIRSVALSPDGRPTGTASQFVVEGRRAAVASNSNGFAALTTHGNGTITLATFNQDGRLARTTQLPQIEGVGEGGLAIAANGNGYLVLVTGLAEVWAAPLTASGEVGRKLILESRPPSPQRYGYLDAAATWNGSEWAVTYTISDHSSPWELVAATVDVDVTTVMSRETAPNARAAGIAVAAGRTMAGRLSTSGFPSIPQLLELPLANHPPRLFTFKAAEQYLVASASAGDTVLVVWRERLNGVWTLRAGIRTASGQWSERALLENHTGPVVAVTTGNDFAVFVYRNGPVALRFDRQLRLMPEVALPLMPDAAASNGTAYALVGGGKAVLFTPAGVVGQPVELLGQHVWRPAITSDGQNFLIARVVEPYCQFLLCIGGAEIAAARYDGSLRPLDAQELTITDVFQTGPVTAWNGRDYVITWTDGEKGQFAATVPRSGGNVTTKQISTRKNVREPRMVAARGGVVITGRDVENETTWVDRFLFLAGDGTVTEREPMVYPDVFVTSEPRLEAFADGRLAYVASQGIVAAPQHAASHVTMAVESFTRLPGAPQLTVSADQRTVTLSWTAPTGAANGYRVEYRIGDGSWNEADQWLDAGTLKTTIRLAFPGQRAAFRVRAWSDSGTGPYSIPATVNYPRRRAIR